jgi:hypothetical protein
VTLLAAREQFVKFSGRYDLVVNTSAWANNGADIFIQAGQQWLDETFEIGKKEATWYKTLAVGDWYALVPSCRAIHEVWMSSDTEGKWQLEKVLWHELRLEEGTNPSDIDMGTPCVWANVPVRTVPETVAVTTIAKYGTVSFTEAANNFGYQGLVWLAPSDVIATLEVLGNFYHSTLTADTDKNFWTEEKSFVLTLAACRSIEMSYRNLQGVNDWEDAIRRQLLGLEFDLVDTESVDVREMRG